MARKKKPGHVAEVDVIKAGINRDKKITDGLGLKKDDDNNFVVSRNKKSKENATKVAAKIILQEELKLKKLKETLALEDNEKIEKLEKKIKKDDKKKKKKGKKDKKKKNKNKDNDDYDFMSTWEKELGVIEDSDDGKKKKKKKDGPKLVGLTKKEKKKANAKKTEKKELTEEEKMKKEISASFKQVEKLTRENINDINGTLDDVDKYLGELDKNSRTRGISTARTNFLQTKATLMSAKQGAIKDIASVKKTIYDIELKKEKQRGTNQDDGSQAALLARVFPTIVGNKNYMKQVSDDTKKSGKNKNGKKGKKHKDYQDALMAKEKELLKSGDIKYNAFDANIELEGKYDIVIHKSFETQEWKFIAVDKVSNKVLKIDKKMLPKKKHTEMIFDDEKDIARDKKSGSIYRVIQTSGI